MRLPRGLARRGGVFVPVFDWRKAGDLFEDIPKRFGIGIANTVHDLADGPVLSLQTAFGRFDPDALDIFVRGIVRGIFKAAYQVSFAHRKTAGEFFHRQFFAHILFDKRLDLFDGIIVVVFLAVEDDEGGLGAAFNIDLQDLGAKDRRFAAVVFLYKVEHEVQ